MKIFIITIFLFHSNFLWANLSEVEFSNNKDGIVKTFYPDGKVMSETTFQNGVPVGIANIYYENGHTYRRINFNNNASYEEFLPDGTKNEGIYLLGFFIEIKSNGNNILLRYFLIGLFSLLSLSILIKLFLKRGHKLQKTL